jgi:hypothetical protein
MFRKIFLRRSALLFVQTASNKHLFIIFRLSDEEYSFSSSDSDPASPDFSLRFAPTEVPITLV